MIIFGNLYVAAYSVRDSGRVPYTDEDQEWFHVDGV